MREGRAGVRGGAIGGLGREKGRGKRRVGVRGGEGEGRGGDG